MPSSAGWPVGHEGPDVERRGPATLLDSIPADEYPFTTGGAPDRNTAACRVRPELAAEIEYLEYNASGSLRHPVWRGLRGFHGP